MVPHGSHRNPRRLLTRFGLATLCAIAGAFAACTKVPLVAPSGTVISLVANTNVLPVNGSATITAVLIQNGTTSTGTGTGTGTTTTTASSGVAVHNGTLVSFTTTLGTIEPVQARTTNGQTSVTLTADGRSGVATVTAISGGASQTIKVNVGAAAAARIVVAATPQALPAVGGKTTVVATVEDQEGNAIAGVPVTFSTTNGSLDKTTVVSDDSGNASTTLTTTAAATVTASSGGTTGTLSGTVAITLLSQALTGISGPFDRTGSSAR